MIDLAGFFLTIHDPRVDRTKKHSLCKIIGLAVYAIIAGANDWEDIEDTCIFRQNELEKIMDLENGIPSHDTFQRVCSRLEPKALADATQAWMESLTSYTEQIHIAIDGKTIRRSFDTAKEQSAFHTLNAFVVNNLTILRHEVGTNKDSEITMIPKILKSLNLKNAIVSIDAIGCQKNIIAQIIEEKGDYLIALKGNQPNLHSEVIDYFNFAKNNELDEKSFQIYKTTEKSHGRFEERSYFCLDTNYYPLSYGEGFKDIKSIVQVSRIRETNKGQTYEKEYYISSLKCEAKQLGSVIRGHWAIENSLHHVLDVNYCEDDNRTRKDHAPANFSMFRKTALSLINLHKDKELTQKKARTRARLDHSYAMMLLMGKPVKEI